MTGRVWAMLALLVALAGCVAAPKPSLSVDEARTLKIVAVEGRLAEGARAAWTSVRDEFRESRNLQITVEGGGDGTPRQATEPELPVAEFRAYLAKQFDDRVRKAFPGTLQRKLNGPKPVRLVVTLHNTTILSIPQRLMLGLLVGQSANDNMLVATVALVEPATGRTIVALPDRRVAGAGAGAQLAYAGGEWAIEADPMVRLLNRLRDEFETWLFEGA